MSVHVDMDVHMCMCVCMYMCVHTCICMYMSMYAYLCVPMSACVSVCVSLCVHVCVYTHTHMHSHIFLSSVQQKHLGARTLQKQWAHLVSKYHSPLKEPRTLRNNGRWGQGKYGMNFAHVVPEINDGVCQKDMKTPQSGSHWLNLKQIAHWIKQQFISPYWYK